MLSFNELLAQGTSNVWFFIPSAILLGALHGLEPGHSKTMMAAFIVAVKGTVTQAMLLGLAATISHTAVVWGIALGGMYFWQGVASESFEPYFQIASAILIILIALWMLWRTLRDQRAAKAATSSHLHDDGHAHHTHDETRQVNTGHGIIIIGIYEDGVPPVWRVKRETGQNWAAEDVVATTERAGGVVQKFTFKQCANYLESTDIIPEPHEFKLRLSLGHGDHVHDYDLSFEEHHHPDDLANLDVSSSGYQDAHEKYHADDIKRRFASREVTTGQIIMFGLTGGLIPCPASITILVLCLQLKQFTLGAVLVLCFSIGLALTLVTVGVVAALSIKHASKRFSWVGTVAHRAPYFSSALIILVGIYMGYQGWVGLTRHAV